MHRKCCSFRTKKQKIAGGGHLRSASAAATGRDGNTYLSPGDHPLQNTQQSAGQTVRDRAARGLSAGAVAAKGGQPSPRAPLPLALLMPQRRGDCVATALPLQWAHCPSQTDDA